MTQTPTDPALQEVRTRNRTAHQIVTELSYAIPDEKWQAVRSALADVPALIAQIHHLRSELTATRLRRANLAASALATLAAQRDGERDPLSYLRDELASQGYVTRREI